MSKERVIAEMAEQACPNFYDCVCGIDNKPCDKICGAAELFEKLYDRGYRKIDGTNYVSMEWHDEQIQHAQDEIEQLRKKLTDVLISIKGAYNIDVERLQKQAVKDFVERLKQKISMLFGSRLIFVDDIDELLKEYEK